MFTPTFFDFLSATMCLAIPGRVLKVKGKRAQVDIGGIRRTVDVSLVDVQPGKYVLVQAGHAVHVMDEKEAQETLSLLREIMEKDDA